MSEKIVGSIVLTVALDGKEECALGFKIVEGVSPESVEKLLRALSRSAVDVLINEEVLPIPAPQARHFAPGGMSEGQSWLGERLPSRAVAAPGD